MGDGPTGGRRGGPPGDVPTALDGWEVAVRVVTLERYVVMSTFAPSALLADLF